MSISQSVASSRMCILHPPVGGDSSTVGSFDDFTGWLRGVHIRVHMSASGGDAGAGDPLKAQMTAGGGDAAAEVDLNALDSDDDLEAYHDPQELPANEVQPEEAVQPEEELHAEAATPWGGSCRLIRTSLSEVEAIGLPYSLRSGVRCPPHNQSHTAR